MTATGAPASPSLPERFAVLAQALKDLLFRACPHLHVDPVRHALCFLASAWLARTVRRFERLVAEAQAGTLRDPPPRPRRARAETPPPEAPPPEAPPPEASDPPHPAGGAPGTAPRPRLPQKHGWLLDFLPSVRERMGQLEHFLTDAELEAMMRAAPVRFGRVLRPLCRALRIVPPTPAARVLLRLPWKYDPKPERPPRAPRKRRPRTDLIDMHDGRFFTPAQFRRHLGLPRRILT